MVGKFKVGITKKNPKKISKQGHRIRRRKKIKKRNTDKKK